MATPETLDLVVVGAGWFGLCAAKTNHQLHPDQSFAVLDGAATIGGVWAEHRLYPGLKSNNLLGTYQYPDFPMDTATYGVTPGEHMPGDVIHRYLVDYATKFGVLPHVRTSTKVVSAQALDDGGWLLTLENKDKDESTSTLVARKLIAATGLTSEPFMPHLAGQETFGKPLFHSRDFKDHAATLDTARSVTVLGGTKSAWDIVYAYASRGITVDWIIRSTGHGPIWQAPPYVTPLKKWLEALVMTRMITWFSPCIWGDADGYGRVRGFYHRSALGRGITNAFWSVLGGDVLTANKYDRHPETRKLKPWSDAMFNGSSFSILNYDGDFFELVRNGTVRIRVTEITSLSPGTVHVADDDGGPAIKTDLLACVTGWKHVPPIRFLPEGIDKQLGLPHVPAGDGNDKDEPIFNKAAVSRADQEIFKRFPRLKKQPVINNKNKKLVPLTQSGGLSTTDADADAVNNNNYNPATPLTPYTLYRFVLPPSQTFLRRRDIAFAGVVMNFATPLMAQMQALWILALFDGTLPAGVVPDANEPDAAAVANLQYQTVLTSRFGKWRYPAGHGSQFPDFVFDSQPYLDQLVGDLGLRVHRKKGWLAEATSPYGGDDYKDIVAEWQAKVAATAKAATEAKLAAKLVA